MLSKPSYPTILPTQASQTPSEFLPCTQQQTKQQAPTQNHIKPPPGFQQLQPQQIPQQASQPIHDPTLPTQSQLIQQIYDPTLPAQIQLTKQVYTQSLPTEMNIQQQQQRNLPVQFNQNTTPPQQYTIQQNRQNAYHVGQVHQQTMMLNVPCQIL